jgi:hypothetical protein
VDAIRPAAADKMLTLAQASSMVGKAESTIRRLIDKGAIQSQRDEKGRHWVELGPLLAPPLPDSMRKLKSLAAVVFPSEGRKQAYGFLRGFTE